MQILLIEADIDLRKNIVSMLRSQGHRITLTDEGEDALQMLQKLIFDLVITSLMPGKMRVVEFAIAAKNLQPRTPILVTGGYFGPNPQIPFVDAVVQHPVLLQDVKVAVSTLLATLDRARSHRPAGYLGRAGMKPAHRLKKNRT